MAQSELRRFVRHVELYGTEGVLETAKQAGLTPADRGRLVLAMRRIDQARYERDRALNSHSAIAPPWKLSHQERQELGAELIEAGATDKFLRDVLDVGQGTIRTLKSAL